MECENCKELEKEKNKAVDELNGEISRLKNIIEEMDTYADAVRDKAREA